ncbi:50S ribosomal protein L15 [Glycomyces harbinensis]|uniref:Large ribosomal subunit protein uL15 n=1 Tax=Glycomyces harbinensis TaxID=58114 RepID=A0A1G7D1X8_9ACTN|nr:large subunit ribosomal protein L15 [Glycomyces harbinensis]
MAIRIHDLQPAPGAKKAKTRVGRGEGSKGKTAGRGTKGTKARKTVPAGFEGGQMPLQIRLPKLKGFKPHNKLVYQVVNLDRLVELFPDGGEVGPEQLMAVGVLNKKELIKVLGSGELEGVKLDVKAHAFSSSAFTKITAAGGTAVVVDKKTGEPLDA